MGRLGSGGLSWDLRALTLVIFPNCLQKATNDNCERGCEEESIPKKPNLSGLREVTLHKRTRVHNNFKNEYLLLGRRVNILGKVSIINKKPSDLHQ